MVLYCTVLYCTVLYCTVLYCTVLYCTVLYCTVLWGTDSGMSKYCTALHCTALHYCTALHWGGTDSGISRSSSSPTCPLTLSTSSGYQRLPQEPDEAADDSLEASLQFDPGEAGRLREGARAHGRGGGGPGVQPDYLQVVLYCTVLYCTVLYCTVLYCTVLYCTVLYCTVLYSTTCRTGREGLGRAQDQFVNCSLGILARYCTVLSIYIKKKILHGLEHDRHP